MAWRFRAYRVGAESDVVAEWYASEEQRPKVQAKFDQRMRALSGMGPAEWVRPYSDSLDDGLREIRFEASRIAWRPIGFFSGPMEFTFLIMASEHNDRLVPPEAMTTAKRRMEEVKLNRERARDVELA